MHIFLETERLLLRRLTEADLEHLVLLDSDPEVMRCITGGRPTPRHLMQHETLPNMLDCYARGSGLGFWAAVEKATGAFLGWFEFRPVNENSPAVVELGYRLRREAWGQGFATEGAQALIRKGFAEMGVERVTATAMTVNAGSRRVMEKAGLKYLRTVHLTWPEYIDGAEHGDVEYALTKADWEQL